MSELTVYASTHVSRARRIALSLAFGALPPLAGAWWRWARDGRGSLAWPEAILGAALAAGMIVAALRSRAVYRVTLSADTLRIARDPGVTDIYPLRGVSAASEPTTGGWSRDPSETLVITTPDGATTRYRLPDDAHTPGIVDDIAQAQRDGTPLAPDTSAGDTPET